MGTGVALLLIVFLNLAISFWNARVTGKAWHEAKAVGGWIHIVTWAGAVMSAIGFTSAYLFIVLFIGVGVGYISKDAASVASSLGYMMLVVPLLSTSVIITIHSWIQFCREKSLLNVGVAAWNTFTTASNVYSAVTSFGGAWNTIKESAGEAVGADGDFDFDSDLAKAAAIAVVALFGGVLTTMVIMRRYMGTLPAPKKE